MARATREQIYTALFTLVSNCYSWASTPSRRLRLWGDVALDLRPALFMTEGEPQPYAYSSGTTFGSIKRSLKARLWVYIDAKDPGIIGATQLNNIWDAIDAAIFPSGADAPTGKNTLSAFNNGVPMVDYCRVANVPLFDAGDLDGDGLLIVDVEMMYP